VGSQFFGGVIGMFDLDAHIGMHADALRLRSKRSEMIARNLANADTPGFEARDIDFRQALSSARREGGAVSLTATQSQHLRTGGGAMGDRQLNEAASLYRVPVAPSIDGNTVDVQLEQAAFSENAIRYQTTLHFVNSKLRGLMTALTGQ
jgi:flagellar basal-body rod protein FlgB